MRNKAVLSEFRRVVASTRHYAFDVESKTNGIEHYIIRDSWFAANTPMRDLVRPGFWDMGGMSELFGLDEMEVSLLFGLHYAGYPLCSLVPVWQVVGNANALLADAEVFMYEADWSFIPEPDVSEAC